MKDSELLTSASNWSGRHSRGEIKSILFGDLFSRYLKKTKGESCLEIGCVPGRFLAYICRNFGYYPEGIDYVKDTKKITGETLFCNGLREFTLYEEDFTKWKATKQYDLVCSFGFIEHFEGDLNRQVIEKHVKLLKLRGKLLIDIPNFNYFQYLFHLMLNREVLGTHNTKIMNLSYFKKIAKTYNLKILHLDYYGGLFNYWGLTENANFFQRLVFRLLKKVSKFAKKIRFLNNRFFSPFIVFIAEKV
jgi:SAM-dependent methyltransferase